MKRHIQCIRRFQKIVRDFYRQYGRHLPWRMTDDPYEILVSEILLQQTSVLRVLPFYKKFVKEFTTTRSLARAFTHHFFPGCKKVRDDEILTLLFSYPSRSVFPFVSQ